jgi:hypothetical protein
MKKKKKKIHKWFKNTNKETTYNIIPISMFKQIEEITVMQVKQHQNKPNRILISTYITIKILIP